MSGLMRSCGRYYAAATDSNERELDFLTLKRLHEHPELDRADQKYGTQLMGATCVC